MFGSSTATRISFHRIITSTQSQRTSTRGVPSYGRRKRHAKRGTAAPPQPAVVAETRPLPRWICVFGDDACSGGRAACELLMQPTRLPLQKLSIQSVEEPPRRPVHVSRQKGHD